MRRRTQGLNQLRSARDRQDADSEEREQYSNLCEKPMAIPQGPRIVADQTSDIAAMMEPLTPNDITWARMDAPVQPMVVTIVLFLNQPLNEKRLRETLQRRLLSLARFRQRVARIGNRYYWLEDAPLDWNVHLCRVRLSEPADRQALEKQLGDWVSEPLDFARPLWRCFWVENYGTGGVLVFRAHHCIADGVALLRVFLTLTDRAPEAQPANNWTERQWQARLAAKTAKALTPPGWLDRLRWQAVFWTVLFKQQWMPSDTHTALRGRLNGRKRVAWSTPIPLSDITAIRQRLGGRVNDIMLIAMTGALRRYLQARGEVIKPTLTVRLMTPVNLRAYEEEIRLGNQFAVVFPKLPISVPDPMNQLKIIQTQMDRITILPAAMANLTVIHLAGHLPAWLERLALELFGKKATAVLTNVPGPEEPLYLAGAAIKQALAWVPQIVGIGIGVGILSYAGFVTMAVMTDSGVIADPRELVAGFEEEMIKLTQMDGGIEKRR